MAAAYGLEMITDSKKLRDRTQGREIKHVFKDNEYDLHKRIAYDNRFHPIKNIDTAVRMICDNYMKSKNWNLALKRYAG